MKLKSVFLLQIILGITFILSAYSKLIAPGIVEIILVDHHITSSREAAAILVRILIALEFSLGFLLLQKNYIKKFVLPVTFIFLIGFSIYLIYTRYFIGDNQNCGCFGTMIEMSPTESLIKNFILLILTFIIFKKSEADSTNIIIPILLLIVAFIFVFVASPIKKNNIDKFNSYTHFERVGRVDLSEGKILLAVMNLECEHCQAAAHDLAKMKKQFKWFPKLFALYFSEGQVSVDSFETITGFRFPYKIISAHEFFDLVGQSPPRIYFLQNGKIKEYWDKDFIKNIAINFSTSY
ncbi:MAG: hypothetical protein HZA74_05725 [Ignavibacteriales bacterium]|nr:hypothetical protein [Ignavibacteriales bacterium]